MAQNQTLAHPPVQIYQNIVHIVIYSLVVFLCVSFSLSLSFSITLARGSILLSAPKSGGREGILSQAAEGMHRQEVCMNL